MSSDLDAQTPIPRESAARSLHPYILIFILTIATFMELLDMTVTNVSITRISGDLGATTEQAGWVLSSYLIANAAVLPLTGWLAMRLGRKRFYMICVAIFVISSFLCGIAANIESLIFFRAIQGLSGSGLATSEQSLIVDLAPPDKLGRAFAIYGSFVTFASVIGPTFGGWITDTLTWHWIFLINVPIGIISLVLVYLFIEESPGARVMSENFRKEGRGVDWVGVVLFGAGIAALEIVFERGQRENWFESDLILVLTMVAFFSLLLAITWEFYQERPAVDIELFANRNFALASVLIFTVRFVIFGSTFIIPFMAQSVLGYSALDAGMILLPGSILLMIMIQFVGYLLDKVGARIVITIGLIVTALAIWHLASLNANAGFNDLAFGRAFQMFGTAFLSSTLIAVAFYYVKPEKNDNASALISIAGNTGASLGVAFATSLIAQRAQIYISNAGNHLTPHDPNFTTAIADLTRQLQLAGQTAIDAQNSAYQIIWDTVVKQATMNAILDTFYFYIIFIILLIPIVWLLKDKKTSGQ